jgi:hypothetical protein
MNATYEVNGIEGMVARVIPREDGRHAVALIDTDCDEVVAVRIFPADRLEDAKLYAAKIV